MKTSALFLLSLCAALTSAAPEFGSSKSGFHGAGASNKGTNNAGSSKSGTNNSAAGTSAAAAAVAATTAAVPPAAASSSTAASSSSAASGSASGNATANNPDAQNSLTLDPGVLCTGFQQNGQAVQEAGQVASLVSNNNFINFCLTQPNLPLTNGLQVTGGSCNPAPIGAIPSTANMPSSKFVFPTNGGSVPANANFTIQLAINNMETGNFVNAQTNYYAAPQQLNAQGQIIGHTHVTVEAFSSTNDTSPPNPTTFAFFKGINTAAVNGIVTAAVSPGLAAGTYRVCSINAAANHQPVILPVAQHGNSDDCVYFTATDGAAAAAGTDNSGAAAGTAAAAVTTAAAGTAATASSAAAASGTAAAAGSTNKGAANNQGGAAKAGAAKGGKKQRFVFRREAF